MPVTKKSRPRVEEKAELESPESSKPVEIIVRRGALRRYELFKRKAGDLPVKLSWDRRVAQRRSAAARPDQDRRAADRRQDPAFTWEMADFVIVERPEARARRKTSKKSS